MSQSIKQLQAAIRSLSLSSDYKDGTIKGLRFQLKEYELRGEAMNDAERDGLYKQIDHLHQSLIDQSQIVTWYQQWFARNAHWTQRFNHMMKYDPNLGNYDRPGADEVIVIPEVEQWKLVELSPVAEDSIEE